jgi:hypothetical protein
MNKEFIPYEQALELKKLGFNEPCLFAFDNCSTPMRCSDLRTSKQKFNGVNYNSSSYTSQPTFSQAFRWFREKYKLSGTAQYFTGGFYCYTIHDMKDTKKSNRLFTEFETYEEAELACLKKLIEIVKGGDK